MPSWHWWPWLAHIWSHPWVAAIVGSVCSLVKHHHLHSPHTSSVAGSRNPDLRWNLSNSSLVDVFVMYILCCFAMSLATLCICTMVMKRLEKIGIWTNPPISWDAKHLRWSSTTRASFPVSSRIFWRQPKGAIFLVAFGGPPRYMLEMCHEDRYVMFFSVLQNCISLTLCVLKDGYFETNHLGSYCFYRSNQATRIARSVAWHLWGMPLCHAALEGWVREGEVECPQLFQMTRG